MNRTDFASVVARARTRRRGAIKRAGGGGRTDGRTTRKTRLLHNQSGNQGSSLAEVYGILRLRPVNGNGNEVMEGHPLATLRAVLDVVVITRAQSKVRGLSVGLLHSDSVLFCGHCIVNAGRPFKYLGYRA